MYAFRGLSEAIKADRLFKRKSFVSVEEKAWAIILYLAGLIKPKGDDRALRPG
jgi:hypothetical protein